MNDIIEIENIIPIDYQNYIHDVLTGGDFPWIFNKHMVSGDDIFLSKKDNPAGFNHYFYEHNKPVSPFFQMIYPLVLSITSNANIPFNRLYRMRANLTLANTDIGEKDWLLPHIDSFFPHWNVIYYVNDSDGDTILFNETNDDYDSGQRDIDTISKGNFTVKKRVTPKKGKILAFHGRYYHSVQLSRESKYRCLININLGTQQL